MGAAGGGRVGSSRLLRAKAAHILLDVDNGPRMTEPRFPRWLGVAFALYVAVTLFLALHHEARGDEADSWVLMRDGGVGVMLSRTGYANAPALWYLALAPFASAGLPYVAQQIVNLIFVWFAMALFLSRAPFNPVVKVLFLFSYYPVVQYALDARPYGLLIALLFSIAASWDKRHERPVRIGVLAALLANTSSHGLLIAAVIGAVYLGERSTRRDLRRPVILSIAIMILGGVASAIQLWPPADGQKHLAHYIDPGTVPWAIGSAFLPGVEPRLSFAVGLVVLLLAVLAIGNRVTPLLFIALSTTSLLLLFVYVWVSGTWHTGLILMVVIAGVWMAGGVAVAAPAIDGARSWRRYMGLAFEGALAIIFLWGIYAAGREGIADVKWAYSGSREMAEFIARNVPDSTVIAAHAPGFCEPVLAYLPKRQFWYPVERRLGSYMLRDRAFQLGHDVSVQTAAQTARKQLSGQGWLLLVNTELPAAERTNFRLVYANQRHVYARTRERFWLYAPIGHLQQE